MQTRRTELPARIAIGRSDGFTLIEILVALTIFAVIAQSLVASFRSGSRESAMADTRVEAHQAMVAAMDSLARDIRLAGACLPTTGPFISMAGTNNGVQDELWIRLANTANQTCIQPCLAANANAAVNSNTLTLASSAGFAVGSAGYVTNGAVGNFFKVTAIAGNTITTDGRWSVAYAAPTSVSPPAVCPTSVYLMQEHHYKISTTLPGTGGRPVLMMIRDRSDTTGTGVVSPESTNDRFADGISELDVTYCKTDCTLANTTPLPATDAEWRLVKQLIVKVKGQSMSKIAGSSGYHEETASFQVKPRNLLP